MNKYISTTLILTFLLFTATSNLALAIENFIPSHPINLKNDADLVEYYGNIVPYLKRDLLGESLDVKYNRIYRWHPKLSLTAMTYVRSPLSYLLFLNKIGKELRSLSYEKHGIELATVPLKHHLLVNNNKNINISIPVVDIALYPETFITDTVSLFTSIIYESTLKQRGFKYPVTFAGYVPHNTASYYATYHLFMDDSLFSGAIVHGKFPHILQNSLLIDKFGYSPARYEEVIIKAWGSAFDSAHDFSVPSITLPCGQLVYNMHELCDIKYNEIINGHSALPVTQWLYKNLFSRIVQRALSDPKSTASLISYLGLDKAAKDQLSEMVLNIRAVENMAILDINNDVRTVYQEIKSISDSHTNPLWLRILKYPYPLYASLIPLLPAALKIEPSDKTEERRKHALIKFSRFLSDNLHIPDSFEDFFSRVVFRNFNTFNFDVDINATLMPVRRKWLKDHGEFNIVRDTNSQPDDNAKYIIYQHPNVMVHDSIQERTTSY